MRQRLRSLAGKVGARDMFVFAGIALVSAGSAMIYPPAGAIMAGAILLLIGILGVPTWHS